MNTLQRETFRVVLPDWQPGVLQLLDESHLAAWSDDAHARAEFASTLAEFMGHQRDTQVVHIHGRHVTDLASLAEQLARVFPDELPTRLQGEAGLERLLRARASFATHAPPRFRYYIWHDADEMIKANPRQFGQAVQTIAGIAAEAEYALDEPLTIHRAVFLGSAVLDVYAEDERARFQSWDDAAPWAELTGIEAPSVRSERIETLLDL